MPSIFELAKTSFIVPPSAQEELSDYFVLKYTKNTLEEKVKHGKLGTIEKHGIAYIPVFLTPMKAANPCALVSFRRVEGYPYGYALIKDFKERKGSKK